MRKLTGILLLFIALLGVGNKMNAQYYVLIPTYTNRFSFSAEGGLNLSKIGENEGGTSFKPGYFIGAKADFQVNQQYPVYLESGIRFTTKGLKGKLSENKADIDIEAMYIQIPVNAMYVYQLREDLGIAFRVGPYVAFGVGGQTKQNILDDKGNLVERKVDTFGKNPRVAEKTDFGVAAGVAFNIDKLSISATYEHGFNDAVQFGGTKNVRNIAIGLSYYYR